MTQTINRSLKAGPPFGGSTMGGAMVKRLPVFLGLILALGVGSAAQAAEVSPKSMETRVVPKPVLLSPQEKIPDKTKYRLPKPPRKNIDGTQLDLANNEDEPPQDVSHAQMQDEEHSKAWPVGAHAHDGIQSSISQCRQ